MSFRSNSYTNLKMIYCKYFYKIFPWVILLIISILCGCGRYLFHETAYQSEIQVISTDDLGCKNQLYFDTFEDENIGDNPTHWIEDNQYNFWSVIEENGNKMYRAHRNEVSPYSWLHVFEKNVTLETRFKLMKFDGNQSSLGFAVRFNDTEAMIKVEYDFKTSMWNIAERQGEDFEWIERAEKTYGQTLELDIWYQIRIVSNNETVTVFIDDMSRPKLWATDLKHQSPGRVALIACNTTVDFDDVSLRLRSGMGRVNDGVLEYTIGYDDKFREGASIIEKENGDLLLLHRNEMFISTDQGQTFSDPKEFSWPVNRHAHHSVIRLQSGKLLYMVAEYARETNKFDAPLRFRSILSADDGKNWMKGGLTWEEFREGLEGVSPAIVMNDKLTQIQDGRVFFVVPIRTDDGEKITGHKTEVYFSDDEGYTWNKSDDDSDSFTKLNRYAEGKIIQTTDGTLRLYTPYNDSSCIRYSESYDNGLTWKGDYPLDYLKNSRSSFALLEDTYASIPTFYMVWVYNDTYDTEIPYLPRSRLSLARSYDGKDWEYLMDIERWVSPNKKNRRAIVQILDPSLTATEKYLYITIGRSDKASEHAHSQQRLRLYRIEKNKLTPYKQWPCEF